MKVEEAIQTETPELLAGSPKPSPTLHPPRRLASPTHSPHLLPPSPAPCALGLHWAQPRGTEDKEGWAGGPRPHLHPSRHPRPCTPSTGHSQVVQGEQLTPTGQLEPLPEVFLVRGKGRGLTWGGPLEKGVGRERRQWPMRRGRDERWRETLGGLAFSGLTLPTIQLFTCCGPLFLQNRDGCDCNLNALFVPPSWTGERTCIIDNKSKWNHKGSWEG